MLCRLKINLKFQNNKQNVESVATFQDQHQESLQTIQQYLKETQSSTAGFTEHVRESLETLRNNSSARRTALLGHFTQGEIDHKKFRPKNHCSISNVIFCLFFRTRSINGHVAFESRKDFLTATCRTGRCPPTSRIFNFCFYRLPQV